MKRILAVDLHTCGACVDRLTANTWADKHWLFVNIRYMQSQGV